MQADIETHRAAMSLTPHVRCDSVVGARSALPWAEPPGGAGFGSIATGATLAR